MGWLDHLGEGKAAWVRGESEPRDKTSYRTREGESPKRKHLDISIADLWERLEQLSSWRPGMGRKMMRLSASGEVRW